MCAGGTERGGKGGGGIPKHCVLHVTSEWDSTAGQIFLGQIIAAHSTLVLVSNSVNRVITGAVPPTRLLIRSITISRDRN